MVHALSIYCIFIFRYRKANGRSTCQEVWQNKGDQPYTLFLFIIQYMIPLALIVILYSISWNAIRKQNHVIIKMQQLQQKGSRHFSRSNSLDVGVLRKSSGRSAVDGAGIQLKFIMMSWSNFSFLSEEYLSSTLKGWQYCWELSAA